MDIERFATEGNNLLPSYDLRIYLIVFLLLWSIPLLFPIPELKSKISTILLNLGILLFFSATLVGLVYVLNLNLVFFTSSLLLTIPLIYIFLLYLGRILTTIFSKRLPIFSFPKYLVVPVYLLLMFVFFASLFARPYTSSNTAVNGNILNDAGQMELVFTIPVKKDSIEVNLSPETESVYEYSPFLGSDSWITGVKIFPKKSFLPDQKIVVYTTGLKRIFWGGEMHEQSIEYFTPPEPEIKGVSVENGAKNVAVNTDIVLELDSENQDFINWDFKFDPYINYTLDNQDSTTLVLKPQGLKQGIQYKVQILKTIIQYDTQTEQELSRLETEVEKEIYFTTIFPPGIEGFNRKNTMISNSEPLRIDFEVPLSSNSLEEYFSISPQIEGTLSLNNSNKQLVFTSNTPFAKDTEYTVVVKKGLHDQLGGYIENDITLKFKTAGTVVVNSVSPTNNSTGLSISTKSLAISFNQPVDHDSAQSKFSISPSAKGTFSWKDNTMYYTFSSNLDYGTKYTYSLGSGIKSLYGNDSNQKYSYSFTTKNETILLNVPLYYQTETFSCNLAATKMILAHKGISVSESRVKSGIGIGEDPNSSWVESYGTHWGPLSSYILSKGVTNSVKRGWNLTDALKEVKAGHPVLLYVYNNYTQPQGPFTLPGGATGYKGMHSEVIVGFVGKPENPIQVITNDPWRGRRYLSPATLKSLWGYINNTAIVIY